MKVLFIAKVFRINLELYLRGMVSANITGVLTILSVNGHNSFPINLNTFSVNLNAAPVNSRYSLHDELKRHIKFKYASSL